MFQRGCHVFIYGSDGFLIVLLVFVVVAEDVFFPQQVVVVVVARVFLLTLRVFVINIYGEGRNPKMFLESHASGSQTVSNQQDAEIPYA